MLIKEASQMVKQETKDRMQLRKVAEKQSEPYVEPCFDMNQKEYIRRDDADAHKYQVVRMDAKIAHSIDPAQIRTDQVSMKKLFIKHAPGYRRA